MTIEQKAREIALIVAEDGGVPWSQEPYAAARLGIIEGLEMAAKWHDEQAKIYDNYADQEWFDKAAEKSIGKEPTSTGAMPNLSAHSLRNRSHDPSPIPSREFRMGYLRMGRRRH